MLARMTILALTIGLKDFLGGTGAANASLAVLAGR